jgi:hypothetical protein
MARRDWRRNINVRGHPSDDRAHAAANGVRQRTRSPRGCRHGGATDSGSDGRGRSLSRSPPVCRQNRQPPRHDDEGCERRCSRSPVGDTLCQNLSPVRSHGEQKEGDQTVPAGVQPTVRNAHHAKDRTLRATPAARCFSDPSLSFLPRLHDEDTWSSSFLPRIAVDPMVMEFTSSFTTCVGRTSTVATVQLPDISPSASRPYIPVSLEWAPCEDTRQAVDVLQMRISLSASPPYVPVSQDWAPCEDVG